MKDILCELEDKVYISDVYKDYDIRESYVDEYGEVSDFLRDYWQENHVFVLSKNLFDFQHLDVDKSAYNFLIAKEKKTGNIHAILGFVPIDHFDKKIARKMVWPCIWKKRPDAEKKGLGVTMYHYLKNSMQIETMSMIGLSDAALNIYKSWNFDTGLMQHFVMRNFLMEDSLAKGLSSAYSRFDNELDDDKILVNMSKEDYDSLDDDCSIFGVNSIYKTKNFYYNRYYNHPIYEYLFLGIKSVSEYKAIIVARVCSDGKTHCLRIVDLIGDVCNLIGVKNQLQKYLQTNKFEYVDFIEYGLEDELIKEAGFVDRTDYKDMVIPNYFEPFVQKNIDLDFSYKTVVKDSKKILFKADADQDRPNLLV